MDKLQAWLERITQPPKSEVANLDYWDFLVETRTAVGAHPVFRTGGVACPAPMPTSTAPQEPSGGAYS